MMHVRRMLFTSLPVLGFLLALEGLSRVVPAPSPSSLAAAVGGGAAILLEGNPYLGWELAPGSRVEASGAEVSVNPQRFRGPTRGPRQGPRALALGDSSIYGFGVDDAAVFTAQLEDQVNAEFINGGVPGYSSFQALNLLALRGLTLEPDLLIVGTLWSDNNFDTFVDQELLLGSDGVKLRYLLSERSGLLGWLEYLGLAWQSRQRFGRVGWMKGDVPAGERRVPVEAYAKNLARFCEVMAAREGGVLFLMLANREDIRPTLSDPPWTPYREVMRQTASACEAPIVEMPPIFAAQASRPDELIMDEMHPNARGHRLIAESVAAALKQEGWPARPLRVKAPISPVSVEDPFAGQAERWFGGSRAASETSTPTRTTKSSQTGSSSAERPANAATPTPDGSERPLGGTPSPTPSPGPKPAATAPPAASPAATPSPAAAAPPAAAATAAPTPNPSPPRVPTPMGPPQGPANPPPFEVPKNPPGAAPPPR